MQAVNAALEPLLVRYEEVALAFDWEATPFTTWHVPAVACASYLAAVALLYGPAAHMSKQLKADKAAGKPRKVTFMTHVFALHNLGVCLLSLAMFVGGAVEVYRRVTWEVVYGGDVGYGSGKELNWKFLFCEDTSMQSKGPIFFWVSAEFGGAHSRTIGCVVAHSRNCTPLMPTAVLHLRDFKAS